MTDEGDAQRLLDRLFAAIDARDMDGFLACIAEQGRFRFGSAPAVTGHDAIRAAVDAFFASIAGLRHDVQRHVSSERVLVAEGQVTYTRHDGSEITLPFADVFEIDEGLISDYRIYMDIAPLHSA